MPHSPDGEISPFPFLTCHCFHLEGDKSLPQPHRRALGYITAGNAYCSQFEKSSPNCSYPCETNNEECIMAGALQYGVYSCPDSLVRRPNARSMHPEWVPVAELI